MECSTDIYGMFDRYFSERSRLKFDTLFLMLPEPLPKVEPINP